MDIAGTVKLGLGIIGLLAVLASYWKVYNAGYDKGYSKGVKDAQNECDKQKILLAAKLYSDADKHFSVSNDKVMWGTAPEAGTDVRLEPREDGSSKRYYSEGTVYDGQ